MVRASLSCKYPTVLNLPSTNFATIQPSIIIWRDHMDVMPYRAININIWLAQVEFYVAFQDLSFARNLLRSAHDMWRMAEKSAGGLQAHVVIWLELFFLSFFFSLFCFVLSRRLRGLKLCDFRNLDKAISCRPEKQSNFPRENSDPMKATWLLHYKTDAHEKADKTTTPGFY